MIMETQCLLQLGENSQVKDHQAQDLNEKKESHMRILQKQLSRQMDSRVAMDSCILYVLQKITWPRGAKAGVVVFSVCLIKQC